MIHSLYGSYEASYVSDYVGEGNLTNRKGHNITQV